MRAMLLAAGAGKRMSPLTLSLPKPAIPVLGRPLAVRVLKRLGAAGIDRAVVNLHHLAGRLRELLERDVEPGMPALDFTFEERILGTAGGLRHAGSLLRDGSPIVVHNSDFLSDIDLRSALDAHRASGCPATLVLVARRRGYSTVEVDRRGRVLSIAGAPEAEPSTVTGRYTFTGCHIIEEEVLERIPEGGPSSIIPVYRELANEGRLGSHVHDGFWWEFGTPRQYLDGVARLLELGQPELRKILDHDRIETTAGAVVALGPGCRIDPSVRFAGRSAVGMACLVGRGSQVEDSVIMPEAWVGPNCRLRRSIVGPGVELPAGFRAEDELVCADPGSLIPLPPEARRLDGLVLQPFAADTPA